MLLNKESLLAHKFTNKRDGSAYALGAVYITDEKTVATDGIKMIEITHQKRFKDEDFPKIEGVEIDNTETLKPVSLDRESAIQAIKMIPKAKNDLPILKHVQLDVSATNKNGGVHLLATDLERVQKIEPKKVEGGFPQFERAYPKKDPIMTIGFNPKQIADAFTTLSEIMGPFSERSGQVRVNFYDSESPIVIEGEVAATGQSIKCVVSPYHLKDQELVAKAKKIEAIPQMLSLLKEYIKEEGITSERYRAYQNEIENLLEELGEWKRPESVEGNSEIK